MQSNQNNLNSQYLINEMCLIDKCVKYNRLDDILVVELIRRFGAVLRRDYFLEIATGNIFKALGYLNYQVQNWR